MQKNDFEKQVKQQMEDFALLPSEAVWQKVEARVQHEKKRRRILFFWLFAGILLVGGGTGVLLVNKSEQGKNVSATQTNTMPAPADEKNKMKEENHDQDATAGLLETQEKQNEKADQNIDDVDKDEALPVRRSSTIVKENVWKNAQPKTIAASQKPESKPVQKKEETIADTKKNEPRETENITVTETKEEKIITEEPKATVESKPTPKAAEENNIVPVKKTVKSKQWTWGVTMLAGVSDNVSANFLPGAKSAERGALNYNSPTTGQSSQPGSNYSPGYIYSSSFSFGAGVVAEKQLTKRIGISAGLSFQSMNADITVGTKVDSFRTFYDSALMKTAYANTFYRAGENGQHQNRYHLIQLPVSILFRVNKNELKPITFSAGLSGGLLVGSNAVYLNYKQRIYYKEKDHFNQLMLNTQGALTFTLFNQRNTLLQAGPYFQYQLSNLTKPSAGSNEHLMFFGLKGKLLFKNFNK